MSMLMMMNSVDLALPKDKKPTLMKTFWESRRTDPRTVANIIGPEYAVGSSSSTQNNIFYEEDLGLFPAVYEAWKNHWNLRTSPEDWWYYVACRIAKAVDNAAKDENDHDGKVRKLFVDHEGKEKITVDVPVFFIDEVEYGSFFATISSEIMKRIKVPEYAKSMQSFFSTSTNTHLVASHINLMASMQQFFSYEMALCGCGIKSVEMLGTQADWDSLVTKLHEVKKQLEPILGRLDGLHSHWWTHVEHVFRKLAETYSSQGVANKEICDFWAGIFMIGNGWTYGPSGMGRRPAKEYNGWFVKLLLGRESELVEDFFSKENKEKMKGLNSVPMTISMVWQQPPVKDEATLTAGLMGYQVHDGRETFNGIPSVQPHHMWAMKLPPDSKVRRH
eukprot:CAMPEP_0113518314 /NCGR_PEP_ID=MMETSP0014_2-20120614/42815_1 /TAXON_ID=2857 /ORGANISM="Nitzschia sp." /LENGTH=389 /DNA_ID=CAMNT_0000415747 /DNA_START=299 /DNA_END=1468 /DNA_ORIENTATION=- /assembly_acc=CAM_ASM_000159